MFQLVKQIKQFCFAGLVEAAYLRTFLSLKQYKKLNN